MTFSYDEDSDVLYVTFVSPKGAVRYVETDHGDILRFCTNTNQIVGVTILFFSRRTKSGEELIIPEVGIVAFSSAMTALVSQSVGNNKQNC